MLLDHFHPPLYPHRHWTGFHSLWAGNIAVDLNRQLPDGWFAEPTVKWSIEIDVAVAEDESVPLGTTAIGGYDAGAGSPPSPVKSIAFAQTTDVVEVQVYRDFGDAPLVGAVELVSPANKDRPETRDAFTAKCEAYLRSGIGLVIVDVVTQRHANLHAELLRRCGDEDASDFPLYASAYRPVARNSHFELDIWIEELRIAGPLVMMPLFLLDGPYVQVHLAETYQKNLRRFEDSNK